MRFSKVGLSYGPADSFVFPLDDGTFTAPFVVRSIDGLDPPGKTVSIGSSLYEGGYLQGSRPINREIVILIGMQPNYSIGETPGDLRDMLYSVLTPKLNVPVSFSLLDDASTVLVTTYGEISKFDSPLFDKDPIAQITMPCTSAFFTKPLYAHPSPGTLLKNPITITNTGNAPTGFDLSITLTAAMSSFSLTNGNGTGKILLTNPFTIGDVIRIVTIAGSRNVTLTRAGVTTSLLPKLSMDSDYLQLHGGVNTLTPSSTNFDITALSFYPRYWGA